MKKYVLCYVFNKDKDQTLLIKKKRPDFLAGKMNGIGGKIEDFDLSVYHAIQRETLEETNMSIPIEQFHLLDHFFNDQGGFELTTFFTIINNEQFEQRKNNIDEIHDWYELSSILNLSNNPSFVEKLQFCEGTKECLTFLCKNILKNAK